MTQAGSMDTSFLDSPRLMSGKHDPQAATSYGLHWLLAFDSPLWPPLSRL